MTWLDWAIHNTRSVAVSWCYQASHVVDNTCKRAWATTIELGLPDSGQDHTLTQADPCYAGGHPLPVLSHDGSGDDIPSIIIPLSVCSPITRQCCCHVCKRRR